MTAENNLTICHFSTEKSGGAGLFAFNIHRTFYENKIANSIFITREKTSYPNTHVINPITRQELKVRSFGYKTLGKFSILKNEYAPFSLEPPFINVNKVVQELKNQKPDVLIFYWISFFLNTKSLLKLKLAFPNTLFVFIPLDNSFLTGGCHLSLNCKNFQQTCQDCPASGSRLLRRHIYKSAVKRFRFYREHSKLVFACATTDIQRMIEENSLITTVDNFLLPLGAVSAQEIIVHNETRGQRTHDTRHKILVRSSKEKRKGTQEFILALKKLARDKPQIAKKIHINSIGDTTIFDGLAGENLSHTYHGFVNREQLLNIYALNDTVFITSSFDHGPIMVNEAQALGLHLICTKLGVAKDIADTASGDIVLDNAHYDQFYQALMQLSAKLKISRRAKAQNRQLSLENYCVMLLSELSRRVKSI